MFVNSKKGEMRGENILKKFGNMNYCVICICRYLHSLCLLVPTWLEGQIANCCINIK